MRTKEFIKEIEELGFEYEKAAEVYFIYDKGGTKYASVCHTTSNQISNTERAWDLIDKDVQEKLFDLLIEYTKTPIDEREEPKKYYLRHRWMQEEDYNYLTLDLEDRTFDLNDIEGFDWTQNKFTRQEIDEIKQKYNTDLSDFEEEEIKE